MHSGRPWTSKICCVCLDNVSKGRKTGKQFHEDGVRVYHDECAGGFYGPVDGMKASLLARRVKNATNKRFKECFDNLCKTEFVNDRDYIEHQKKMDEMKPSYNEAMKKLQNYRRLHETTMEGIIEDDLDTTIYESHCNSSINPSYNIDIDEIIDGIRDNLECLKKQFDLMNADKSLWIIQDYNTLKKNGAVPSERFLDKMKRKARYMVDADMASNPLTFEDVIKTL